MLVMLCTALLHVTAGFHCASIALLSRAPLADPAQWALIVKTLRIHFSECRRCASAQQGFVLVLDAL
jgi:hypothetical protein